MVIGLLFMPILTWAQTMTLEGCQESARENYPLIKKYDLINKTTSYTVDNINKEWLPQINAQVQATYQNNVVTLPDALKTMLESQNYNVKGLNKTQYRIGVDVNQTIWDGGRIRDRKEVTKLENEVSMAQTDVDLYKIREKVNELYFSILLTNERLQINNDLQTLLSSNISKLNAMYQGGTAMECDINSMKAEKLNAIQQATELESTKKQLLHLLSVFCGIQDIGNITKPSEVQIANGNNRPELKLIDARTKLANVQEKLLKSNLMPRLSAFAQGYFGYPGYDMYHDMLHHNPTLNGMIGAKLSWSIGALYTNKNDRTKIQLQKEQNENAREVFLFNNKLEQIGNDENIEKYQKMMAEDKNIIDLRRNVRMSAESKLNHGIIDINNLLQEINRENNAKSNMAVHEIEMLKEMYDKKYTVNE